MTDAPNLPALGRCRLFHRWMKWSEPRCGSVLSDGKEVGDYWHQERACARCNKTQSREIIR